MSGLNGPFVSDADLGDEDSGYDAEDLRAFQDEELDTDERENPCPMCDEGELRTMPPWPVVKCEYCGFSEPI